MKDFTNEIWGYALKNGIEHEKAQVGNVVPKLFQHGLHGKDVSKVVPLVKEIVSKINNMNIDAREEEFVKFKKFVKEREEKEQSGLADLPNVGKKFVVRIAPFPSGALHLGNAKTFVLNKLYAEKYNGKVIVVMDDTIGSAKKPLEEEAYEMILDSLKWLGIKINKNKVIYKSDRLKLYYRYGEELIKKGYAYVDFSSAGQMREMRQKGIESGDRQFPPKEQMARWKKMFKMREGEAVLRLKTGMQHPNPAFRDRVLFKISERKHVRVGKKYKVWPTLEMSWAVDDYLLGITHIIRGNDLRIETMTEQFIWKIFKWKEPVIVHNGLINIDLEDTKISKSKSREDVITGRFMGWDDPRTWSLQSLKRRGILPEAIEEFIKGIGLNKQDTTIPIETLYSINRKILDEKANRYFFVQNPVMLNINGNYGKSIRIPIHPDKKEKREVKVGKGISIEKADFEKLKGKEIRLLHLFNINLGNECEITSIENKNIPRIHWVGESVPASVLMPNGQWIKGIADLGVKRLKVGDIIQFERFGFCRFDGFKEGSYRFWFGHK